MSDRPRPLRTIAPPTGLLRGFAPHEAWSDRRIVMALVRRDIKRSHKQSTIGATWIVLRPLLGTVVFTAVFGGLAGLESDGLPYAVFALVGLMMWQYVSSASQAAASSISDQAELVTKVYFPPILAPLAGVITPLVDLCVTLVAVAIVLAVYGITPTAAVLTLPIWVLLAIVFSLGPGLLFCALNVRFRDASEVFSLLTQLFMFISPLIFASSSVEGHARVALALNPVCGILDGARWALAGGSPPPAVDLLGLATGAVLLAWGLVYFLRSQPRFVDLV